MQCAQLCEPPQTKCSPLLFHPVCTYEVPAFILGVFVETLITLSSYYFSQSSYLFKTQKHANKAHKYIENTT